MVQLKLTSENFYGGCSSVVERLPVEQDAGGSSPLIHPKLAFGINNFLPIRKSQALDNAS